MFPEFWQKHIGTQEQCDKFSVFYMIIILVFTNCLYLMLPTHHHSVVFFCLPILKLLQFSQLSHWSTLSAIAPNSKLFNNKSRGHKFEPRCFRWQNLEWLHKPFCKTTTHMYLHTCEFLELHMLMGDIVHAWRWVKYLVVYKNCWDIITWQKVAQQRKTHSSKATL